MKNYNYLEQLRLARHINIQLFAEPSGNDDNGGNDDNPPAPTEPKKVDKDIFDKTASELAESKKANKELLAKLKEIEDKGKTAEQLAQEKLEEQKKQYEEMSAKMNKLTATNILASVKTTIGLDDTENFDGVLDFIVSNDEESTTKNANYMAKLLKAVYEKGANDSSNDRFENTASNTQANNDKKYNKASAFESFQKNKENNNERVEL